MRRKIAKRIRRECLKRGLEIIEEHWTREPDWKRKECGYFVRGYYKDVSGRVWDGMFGGEDELQTYRLVLDELKYAETHVYLEEIKNDQW